MCETVRTCPLLNSVPDDCGLVPRYQSHNEDPKYIVPVLPVLKKSEIFKVLPRIIQLRPEILTMALDKLLGTVPGKRRVTRAA